MCLLLISDDFFLNWEKGGLHCEGVVSNIRLLVSDCLGLSVREHWNPWFGRGCEDCARFVDASVEIVGCRGSGSLDCGQDWVEKLAFIIYFREDCDEALLRPNLLRFLGCKVWFFRWDTDFYNVFSD